MDGADVSGKSDVEKKDKENEKVKNKDVNGSIRLQSIVRV